MSDSSPPASSSAPSATATTEEQEWQAFLLAQYNSSKACNPKTTLRSVYPIAKRKFEARHMRCDMDLALIANHHKHKKIEKKR